MSSDVRNNGDGHTVRIGADVWVRVKSACPYLGESVKTFVEKACERRLEGMTEGTVEGKRRVVEVGWVVPTAGVETPSGEATEIPPISAQEIAPEILERPLGELGHKASLVPEDRMDYVGDDPEPPRRYRSHGVVFPEVMSDRPATSEEPGEDALATGASAPSIGPPSDRTSSSGSSAVEAEQTPEQFRAAFFREMGTHLATQAMDRPADAKFGYGFSDPKSPSTEIVEVAPVEIPPKGDGELF